MVWLNQPWLKVGMHHTGLAAPHLAVVRFAVLVNELHSVDQRHRLLPVKHRHCMQIWPLCKTGCQRIDAGVDSDGGGIHQSQITQLPVRGCPTQLGEHHYLPLGQDALGVRGQILHRRGIGVTQKISLTETNTQISENPKIFLILYSLCHKGCAEDIGDLQQGLDGLQLVAVLANVFGEVFVDLDHVGLEL